MRRGATVTATMTGIMTGMAIGMGTEIGYACFMKISVEAF